MDEFLWPIAGYASGWVAFATLALLQARKIANGDWVPRTTHEREMERADHDANEWRTEGRIKDQAILTDLGSVKKTTEETGSTLHAFIASIQKATGVTDEGHR